MTGEPVVEASFAADKSARTAREVELPFHTAS